VGDNSDKKAGLNENKSIVGIFESVGCSGGDGRERADG
jgi:hypothetical protein